MHDFAVFRTVSGPYDVPLDDPKPRFGQQRRKNRPRPCCHSPFLYGSTLDLRGISSRSSKRDDVEALDAAAAGAAMPDALLVRAPERDHVHRRGVLYIPLNVPSPIPHRHYATCRRDLVSSLVRRMGEAEAWFQIIGGGRTKLRPRYRPKAGEEPSRPGPHAKITRFMPDHRRLGPHMSSHIPL